MGNGLEDDDVDDHNDDDDESIKLSFMMPSIIRHVTVWKQRYATYE